MLNDLKVIDVASYVAGPAAATVMGDYGADVIKIEPPDGDGYRRLASRYRTDYNWLLTSRNKRSLALDITEAEARKVLHKLIDEADVLLVNFNSSQLTRYNLRYEDLKVRNPRLIFAQITGYGTRGPEAERRAFDTAAWWARSGILDMMKPYQGAPTNGVGGVGDHASAMTLFGAIMLALYRREKTGKGSYVATSLAANGAWSNSMHLQGAIAGYDLAALLDEKGYRSPFFNPYMTRDNRYIVLVGPSPQREWPLICKALSRTAWIDDPRFTDIAAIMKQRDMVGQMFAEEFAKYTLVELVKKLDEADVTYSVVEKINDVLHDAQLIENDIIVKTDSANPDFQWTVNSPLEVDGVKKRKVQEAPDVGQHSREVLYEAGFSEAEVTKLIDLGFVREHS